MLFLKVKSFALAVWSFIRYGDAPLAEHDRRQTICMACEHLRPMASGVFCKACDCPPWAISDLRTKWRMRDVKCPLGKW
jgi:hypothetical protein